jgi:hypothetical protein
MISDAASSPGWTTLMSKAAEHHADGTRAVAPLQKWHAGAAAAGKWRSAPLLRNSFLQRVHARQTMGAVVSTKARYGKRRRIRPCNNQFPTRTRTQTTQCTRCTHQALRACAAASRQNAGRRRATGRLSSRRRRTMTRHRCECCVQMPRQWKTRAWLCAGRGCGRGNDRASCASRTKALFCRRAETRPAHTARGS